MKQDVLSLLADHKLRVTQSRRLVLLAMIDAQRPLSQKDVHEKIVKSDAGISLVTVYRILELFEQIGLVHRHFRTGKFTFCSLREQNGHHILLSCEECGTVQECADADFCKHENRIAQNNGFSPKVHCSELIGLCSSCK